MGRQLSLVKCEVEYGGSFSRGKAKVRRPLSTRKPIHVTLRSSKASGHLALTHKCAGIERILKTQAERWAVRIYRFSINSNHIHMALRGKTRRGIANFFRAMAGLVARLITGAEKGRPFGKFWDEVVWSRVAEWGQAFTALKGYVVRNALESTGRIAYARSIKTSEILRL